MSKQAVTLVIEGTYPWYRGGVSEWVYQYIKAFTKVDFKIVQIATDEYQHKSLGKALYDVPPHVIEFKRIQPPEVTGFWEKDSKQWLEAIQHELNSSFRDTKFVHVANTGFAGWLGMVMAQKHNKPLVLTEHALYWKEVTMGAIALECGYSIPEKDQGRKKIVELFRDIAKQVYRAADKIISVSECNIVQQKEMGATGVLYIPNGVNHTWFRDSKTFEEPLTLGWIGRCASMKNPLKFFDIIEQMNSDVKALMMLCDAGEDELKDRVIQCGREFSNIQLVWNRPTREYIDEMDALCITSHNESQPLVLFEALARQVLPFGWEVGDVKSKYALVVNDSSPVRYLTSRIQILWNNRDKWLHELDKRVERTHKNHTWQSIFETYWNELNPFLRII